MASPEGVTGAIWICALSTLGLLFAEWKAWRAGRVLFKMVAASAFVAAGLASGVLSALPGRLLFAGLLLCWFGDLLLLSPGLSKRFVLGIGAFLLGHVAYSAFFFLSGVSWAGLLSGGLSVSGLAALAAIWLRPHLPNDLATPVLAYLGVISLMVTAAFGAAMAGAPWLSFIGALGFAASDLSVARDRFVAPGFVNGAWGLPLYFGSQMLMATSFSP